MQPTAATPGLLKRLNGLAGAGGLVLSVYVNLDPSRFSTPGERDSELHALLADARKQGAGAPREVRAAIERVRNVFEADPGLMAGATAVAVFVACDGDGEAFEVVELAEAVEPCAVVARTPWLEPLVHAMHPADWAVVLVSRRAARLFRGGRGGLTEVADIADDVHRRHAQGGWSQARFQRGIDEEVAAHVRRVADELFAQHQREPVGHVVLGCSDELQPIVLEALHPELRDRVAGRIGIDVERARATDVLRAATSAIEQTETGRQSEQLSRLDEALGAHGRAAAGLSDVLAALEQKRAATLFVADGVALSGHRCPACGHLAETGGRCPLDDAVMEDVDAVGHAVAAATCQGAEVVVLDDASALDRHGSIAALLRH